MSLGELWISFVSSASCLAITDILYLKNFFDGIALHYFIFKMARDDALLISYLPVVVVFYECEKTYLRSSLKLAILNLS
jgi:hypothetical protein